MWYVSFDGLIRQRLHYSFLNMVLFETSHRLVSSFKPLAAFMRWIPAAHISLLPNCLSISRTYVTLFSTMISVIHNYFLCSFSEHIEIRIQKFSNGRMCVKEKTWMRNSKIIWKIWNTLKKMIIRATFISKYIYQAGLRAAGDGQIRMRMASKKVEQTF